MDFENIMATPVIYRDIASNFMMNPMPMMPMMPMYGVYPQYGVGTMPPALNNDKYEKINEKDNESKHTLRNTVIIGALLTGAALLFGKFFKAPKINLFRNLKPKLHNGVKSAKNLVLNGLQHIKNKTVALGNKLKQIIKKNP